MKTNIFTLDLKKNLKILKNRFYVNFPFFFIHLHKKFYLLKKDLNLNKVVKNFCHFNEAQKKWVKATKKLTTSFLRILQSIKY